MRKPSLAEIEAALGDEPLPTAQPAPVRPDPNRAAPAPDRTAVSVRSDVQPVASPAVVEATSVPPSAPAHVDDAPDELPAVGKVAAEGATRSMWQAFKKAGAAPGKGGGKAGDGGPEEPEHLGSIRAQALTRLPPSRVGMFESVRFLEWDDDSGVARLWFPYEAVSAANYVKKYRGEYEAAFGDQLGRPATFAIEIEPEPVRAAAGVVEEQRPRVVRPNLDEVAAEVADEAAPRPTVDVDAVKDDPIVAALLNAFDGARIVKVE